MHFQESINGAVPNSSPNTVPKKQIHKKKFLSNRLKPGKGGKFMGMRNKKNLKKKNRNTIAHI